LGANFSNPYGHYEDEKVINFHDQVLEINGTTWQVNKGFPLIFNKGNWKWLIDYGIRKSSFPCWGLKDPRICLFLPQWAKVFPSMSILYVYRPCVQCVYSIKRRAARDLLSGKAIEINKRFWTEPDLAIKMYLFYTRSVLNFLENFQGRWAVIKLSDLINGRDIVTELRDLWGYPLHNSDIRDIYDNRVLSETGPNELIRDESLLDEVYSIDNRMDELSRNCMKI
jgi:hypothetical protein